MRRLIRENRRFLVLLALFTAGVLAHQMTLPVLEGSDETLHLNYANLLKNENRLPDRASYATNSTWQESGQPPLAYWVAAQFLRLLNLPPQPDDLLHRLTPVRNLWFTPPDRWNYRDNFNLYYHGPDERAFGNPEVVWNNRMARLPSLAFGALAVIGAYGAAREVFCRDSWALTATAIFAFTPQMVTMSAAVTNDVGSTAFATLTIWQALRLLRLGASPFRLVVLGILLALAGLSKVSALLIAPGVGLVILIDWRKYRRPFGQLLAHGLLIVAALALIFGPWMIYGMVSFNDPLGFRTHKAPGHENQPTPTFAQLLSALPDVYLSYWGKFGTSAIWMSPLMYALFSAIPILSLAGYARYIVYFMRCRSWLHSLLPPPRAVRENHTTLPADSSLRIQSGDREKAGWNHLPAQQAAVLITAFLCVLAGLFQWLRELFSIAYVITGRLMYTGHIAVAIGLAGGLYLLTLPHSSPSGQGDLSRLIKTCTVGLLAAASVILAPLRIFSAFAPPTLLTPQHLPALRGGPIDFDHTIRFLGYAQADWNIYQGEWRPITLCWQVLKPATRPAAFALKFYLSPTVTVGERTSTHGLGHYPSILWRTGDIFCDKVDVPVTGPVEPGQVYNMILVLLDPQNMAADWPATLPPDDTPIQYPFIGQVVGAKR